MFESSGSDDLEQVTDGDYQISRLSILAPFADAILYKDYVDEVENYLKQQLPGQTISMTGHMVIFVQMIKHFITSITNRDYTTILGITIFYATFLVVMVFVVDLFYDLIDPRIRYD